MEETRIISLNVGGKKFTTSLNTLLSVKDSFFSALVSGRISSTKDDSGAYFIDRDPDLFAIILNFLRTNRLYNVNEKNIYNLKHEAEFYSIAPLVEKLELYHNLVSQPICGGIFFQSLLKWNPTDLNAFNEKIKQLVPIDGGLVVVYKHHINFYRLKDNIGWKCLFESEYIPSEINLVDVCCVDLLNTIVAIYTTEIHLYRWFGNYRIRMDGTDEIGCFNLKNYPVNSMFFIGRQLVALNNEKGRLGIWNGRGWFLQDLEQDDVTKITAFDKAESDHLLFLCSNFGVIYLIDMQKFPLRLKDGDLLINEFYKDPDNEEITAISYFHCSSYENQFIGADKSIEIAYGTRNGTVRILVHHPETVGQGPQLYQTIQVHLNSISRIMLNQCYLITMCDKLHVRTWSIVRFRGLIIRNSSDMLSTEPGTKPHSSFQIHSFGQNSKDNIGKIGPFGQPRVGRQVFVEMPYNDCKYANVLYASNGQKICTFKSVDNTKITNVCFMYKHDIRHRQFIVTGHENGNIQIWDLTTAMQCGTSGDNQIPIGNRTDLIANLFDLKIES